MSVAVPKKLTVIGLFVVHLGFHLMCFLNLSSSVGYERVIHNHEKSFHILVLFYPLNESSTLL